MIKQISNIDIIMNQMCQIYYIWMNLTHWL